MTQIQFVMWTLLFIATVLGVWCAVLNAKIDELRNDVEQVIEFLDETSGVEW